MKTRKHNRWKKQKICKDESSMLRITMKRFLCALTVLICLSASFAAADSHMAVDCSFSGMNAGRFITVDLYDQDGQTTMVSSLFPETAVVPDASDGFLPFSDYSAFICLTPEIISETVREAEQLISEWTGGLTGETAAGVYSGTLFDKASTLKSCAFSLTDFQNHLRNRIQSLITEAESDTSKAVVCYLLARITEALRPAGLETDPQVLCREYDGGKYLTFLLTDHDDVLSALSLDLSAETEKRMMISYKENGTYSHIDHILRLDDRQVTIESSFGTSAGSVLPSGEDLLIRMAFTLEPKSEEECAFQGIVHAYGLEKGLIINGTLNPSDNAPAGFRASAYIDGQESDALNITIYSETLNRPVSFSDKRIRHMNTESENAEIRLAASSGLLSLAAAVFPALPADYQNLLTRILLK